MTNNQIFFAEPVDYPIPCHTTPECFETLASANTTYSLLSLAEPYKDKIVNEPQDVLLA